MMKQTRTGFTLYLRATAMFVLIAFTSTTVAWGSPTLGTETPRLQTTDQRLETRITSLADQITIPTDLGSIKEVFQHQASASDDSSLKSQVSGLIVHLEDAHGSVEAQLNQEKILRRLRDEYGLNTIFVEGGLGDLRPELLHFFKDSELNDKLMDKLTEVGLVGGVERFLASRGTGNGERKTETGERGTKAFDVSRLPLPSPKAYGVEDAGLYRRELELFREVYDGKTQSDKFLVEMRQALLAKSAASFNKELKDFFREWLFQEELQKDILSHLSFLQKYAQDALQLDLTDAREQYDWPALVRFFKLKNLEEAVRNAQRTTDNEKAKILGWLTEKKFDALFIKNFEDFLKEERCALSVERCAGKDARTFFEDFYAKAAPKGFKFENYPVLSKRIGMMILSQELQTDELVREMQRLNEKILDVLAKTPEEKRGVAKYREYLTLRKLLSLELTRGEFDEFSARPQTIDHRQETKNKSVLTPSLSPGERIGEGVLLKSPVSSLMSRALEFYEVAKKREEAIFKNMLSKMKERGEPNAVLITGGFHSEGLSKFMKDGGLSYVRIAPRISGKVDDSGYLRVMTGGLAPFQRGTGTPPPAGEPVPEKVPVPLSASNARQPSLADGRLVATVSPDIARLYHGQLLTLMKDIPGETLPNEWLASARPEMRIQENVPFAASPAPIPGNVSEQFPELVGSEVPKASSSSLKSGLDRSAPKPGASVRSPRAYRPVGPEAEAREEKQPEEPGMLDQVVPRAWGQRVYSFLKILGWTGVASGTIYSLWVFYNVPGPILSFLPVMAVGAILFGVLVVVSMWKKVEGTFSFIGRLSVVSIVIAGLWFLLGVVGVPPEPISSTVKKMVIRGVFAFLMVLFTQARSIKQARSGKELDYVNASKWGISMGVISGIFAYSIYMPGINALADNIGAIDPVYKSLGWLIKPLFDLTMGSLITLPLSVAIGMSFGEGRDLKKEFRKTAEMVKDIFWLNFLYWFSVYAVLWNFFSEFTPLFALLQSIFSFAWTGVLVSRVKELAGKYQDIADTFWTGTKGNNHWAAWLFPLEAVFAFCFSVSDVLIQKCQRCLDTPQLAAKTSKQSESRWVPYTREEVVTRIDQVVKVMQAEELPGGIKDTIAQIQSDKMFQEGGVVYVPSIPGAELLVIGDLHGDLASYHAILRQHNTFEKIKSGKLYVLFLGDYVVGGLKSMETMMEVMDLKLKYPDKVILMRGNHDERRSPEENRTDREQNKKVLEETGFPSSSFYDDVHDRYDGAVYDAFTRFFESLPSLAVTGNGIVLAHAAPPSGEVRSLRDIVGNPKLHHQMRIARAIEKIPAGHQNEFLHWPKSLIVNDAVFDRFMNAIGGKVFIRGHVHIHPAQNPIFNRRLETIISTGGRSPDMSGYMRDYRHDYGTYALDAAYETTPPEAVHYVDPSTLSIVSKEMEARELLRPIVEFLTKGDALPEHADVLLILGNDDLQFIEAAAGVHAKASAVVVSGGVGRLTPFLKEKVKASRYATAMSGDIEKMTEAAIIRDILVANGVPSEKIMTEEKATSTPKNFLNSRAWLNGTVIYMQTPFQQVRARAVFQKYFGDSSVQGISYVAPASIPDIESLSGEALVNIINILTGYDAKNADGGVRRIDGELDKLEKYPEHGKMVRVDIPPHVSQAAQDIRRIRDEIHAMASSVDALGDNSDSELARYREIYREIDASARAALWAGIDPDVGPFSDDPYWVFSHRLAENAAATAYMDRVLDDLERTRPDLMKKLEKFPAPVRHITFIGGAKKKTPELEERLSLFGQAALRTPVIEGDIGQLVFFKKGSLLVFEFDPATDRDLEAIDGMASEIRRNFSGASNRKPRACYHVTALRVAETLSPAEAVDLASAVDEVNRRIQTPQRIRIDDATLYETGELFQDHVMQGYEKLPLGGTKSSSERSETQTGDSHLSGDSYRSEMRETITDLSTLKAKIAAIWEERRQRHNAMPDRPKVADPIMEFSKEGFLMKGVYQAVDPHKKEDSMDPNPPAEKEIAVPKWGFGDDEKLSLLLHRIKIDGKDARVLLTLDIELPNESLLMLDRPTPLTLIDEDANLTLLKFHRQSGYKGYINLWGIGSMNRAHDHLLDDMPIFGFPATGLGRYVDGIEIQELADYGAATLVYASDDDEKLKKLIAKTAKALLKEKIPHQLFLEAGRVIFVLRGHDPQALYELEGEYFGHRYLTGHFVGGIVGYPKEILDRITPEAYQEIMRRAGQPREARDRILALLMMPDGNGYIDPVLGRIGGSGAKARSESRPLKSTSSEPNSAELVDTPVDLRKAAGWSSDTRIGRVVLVTDNTGTLTTRTDEAIGGDILSGLSEFMKGERNFLLVNSGDFEGEMLKAHRPFLEGRERLSPEQLGRYVRIAGNGQTVTHYIKGEPEQTDVPGWDVETRVRYVRVLLDTFFNQLEKELQDHPDRLFARSLQGISSKEIQEARRDARQRFETLVRDGEWGKERRYVFRLLPEAWGGRIGSPYLYDIGFAVCLELQDTNTLFNGFEKRQQDTQRFAADVDKKVSAILPSEMLLHVSYGNTFVFLCRSTKSMAVAATLKPLLESMEASLAPDEKILVIFMGDGRNDIPTFKLDIGSERVAGLNFYLNHDPADTSLLTPRTYISGEERLNGAQRVIRFASEASGKKISELKPFSAKQWRTLSKPGRVQDPAFLLRILLDFLPPAYRPSVSDKGPVTKERLGEAIDVLVGRRYKDGSVRTGAIENYIADSHKGIVPLVSVPDVVQDARFRLEIIRTAEIEGIRVDADTRIGLFIGERHIVGEYYYPLFQSVVNKVFGRKVNLVYLPFAVEEKGVMTDERLTFVKERLRKDPLLAGAVITRPWKTEFLDILNDNSSRAEAVNYIVKVPGEGLKGYATDARAWIDGLHADLGEQYVFSGKRLVIIGAGGAARELAIELNGRKIRSVTFADNSNASLDSLRSILDGRQTDYDAEFVTGDDLSTGVNSPALHGAIRKADMVVNATGIGRGKTLGQSPLTDHSSLASVPVVSDLISGEYTEFLKQAELAGVPFRSMGRSMFIYGFVQFIRGWVEPTVLGENTADLSSRLFSAIHDHLMSVKREPRSESRQAPLIPQFERLSSAGQPDAVREGGVDAQNRSEMRRALEAPGTRTSHLASRNGNNPSEFQVPSPEERGEAVRSEMRAETRTAGRSVNASKKPAYFTKKSARTFVPAQSLVIITARRARNGDVGSARSEMRADMDIGENWLGTFASVLKAEDVRELIELCNHHRYWVRIVALSRLAASAAERRGAVFSFLDPGNLAHEETRTILEAYLKTGKDAILAEVYKTQQLFDELLDAGKHTLPEAAEIFERERDHIVREREKLMGYGPGEYISIARWDDAEFNGSAENSFKVQITRKTHQKARPIVVWQMIADMAIFDHRMDADAAVRYITDAELAKNLIGQIRSADPRDEAGYIRAAYEAAYSPYNESDVIKTGAVLVSKDGRVIGAGYNGAPAGQLSDLIVMGGDIRVEHLMGNNPSYAAGHKDGNISKDIRDNRVDLRRSICAEQRAIFSAISAGEDLQGATLYTTLRPCRHCSLMIHNLGPIKIRYTGPDFPDRFTDAIMEKNPGAFDKAATAGAESEKAARSSVKAGYGDHKNYRAHVEFFNEREKLREFRTAQFEKLFFAAVKDTEPYPFAKVTASFIRAGETEPEEFGVGDRPTEGNGGKDPNAVSNSAGSHEHAEMNLILRVLESEKSKLPPNKKGEFGERLRQIRKHISSRKLSEPIWLSRLIKAINLLPENPFKGGTLFVTLLPCKSCQPVLKALGLKEIIYADLHPSDASTADWIDQKDLNFPIGGPTAITFSPIPTAKDPNALFRKIVQSRSWSNEGHDWFQQYVLKKMKGKGNKQRAEILGMINRMIRENPDEAIADIISFLGNVFHGDVEPLLDMLIERRVDEGKWPVLVRNQGKMKGGHGYLRALARVVDDRIVQRALEHAETMSDFEGDWRARPGRAYGYFQLSCVDKGFGVLVDRLNTLSEQYGWKFSRPFVRPVWRVKNRIGYTELESESRGLHDVLYELTPEQFKQLLAERAQRLREIERFFMGSKTAPLSDGLNVLTHENIDAAIDHLTEAWAWVHLGRPFHVVFRTARPEKQKAKGESRLEGISFEERALLERAAFNKTDGNERIWTEWLKHHEKIKEIAAITELIRSDENARQFFLRTSAFDGIKMQEFRDRFQALYAKVEKFAQRWQLSDEDVRKLGYEDPNNSPFSETVRNEDISKGIETEAFADYFREIISRNLSPETIISKEQLAWLLDGRIPAPGSSVQKSDADLYLALCLHARGIQGSGLLSDIPLKMRPVLEDLAMTYKTMRENEKATWSRFKKGDALEDIRKKLALGAQEYSAMEDVHQLITRFQKRLYPFLSAKALEHPEIFTEADVLKPGLIFDLSDDEMRTLYKDGNPDYLKLSFKRHALTEAAEPLNENWGTDPSVTLKAFEKKMEAVKAILDEQIGKVGYRQGNAEDAANGKKDAAAYYADEKRKIDERIRRLREKVAAETRDKQSKRARSELRVFGRTVAGEWTLPGVTVQQERFENAAVMPSEFNLILHVKINGADYTIGHGDYLVLTLPSGKKIYWGGQHNLSYAFFFKHFGVKSKDLLGSIRWRHADQHPDLNIGSLRSEAPAADSTPEQQIEFGLRTLNAANYLGYVQSRGLARVEHAATIEELDAWGADSEKGGVLDNDLDILIHPQTGKFQDINALTDRLARAATDAEVVFITNSSELQAIYPQGELRPGFPIYIDPDQAVSFGMKLIEAISKNDSVRAPRARSETRKTSDSEAIQQTAHSDQVMPASAASETKTVSPAKPFEKIQRWLREHRFGIHTSALMAVLVPALHQVPEFSGTFQFMRPSNFQIMLNFVVFFTLSEFLVQLKELTQKIDFKPAWADLRKGLNWRRIGVAFGLTLFFFQWFWPLTYTWWTVPPAQPPLPSWLVGVADQLFVFPVTMAVLYSFLILEEKNRMPEKSWWALAKEQLPKIRETVIYLSPFWMLVLGVTLSLPEHVASFTAKNLIIAAAEPVSAFTIFYIAGKKQDQGLARKERKPWKIAPYLAKARQPWRKFILPVVLPAALAFNLFYFPFHVSISTLGAGALLYFPVVLIDALLDYAVALLASKTGAASQDQKEKSPQRSDPPSVQRSEGRQPTGPGGIRPDRNDGQAETRTAVRSVNASKSPAYFTKKSAHKFARAFFDFPFNCLSKREKETLGRVFALLVFDAVEGQSSLAHEWGLSPSRVSQALQDGLEKAEFFFRHIFRKPLPDPSGLHKVPVQRLGWLGARLDTALRKANITTVEELRGKGPEGLLLLRGVGRTDLEDLNTRLAYYGLPVLGSQKADAEQTGPARLGIPMSPPTEVREGHGRRSGPLVENSEEMLSLLFQYLANHGIDRRDAGEVAATLVRSRPRELDYLVSLGALAPKWAEALKSGSPRSVRRTMIADAGFAEKIRELLTGYAVFPDKLRAILLKRLVPAGEIKAAEDLGIPDHTLVTILEQRYSLFPRLKEALVFIKQHSDEVGGVMNAWKILVRQGLEKAEAFVGPAKAFVEAYEKEVGGPGNAWDIVIGQGLENAPGFVGDARPFVKTYEKKVGGSDNVWAIMIRQGLKKVEEWIESRITSVQRAMGLNPKLSLRTAWNQEIIKHRSESRAMAGRLDHSQQSTDSRPVSKDGKLKFEKGRSEMRGRWAEKAAKQLSDLFRSLETRWLETRILSSDRIRSFVADAFYQHTDFSEKKKVAPLLEQKQVLIDLLQRPSVKNIKKIAERQEIALSKEQMRNISADLKRFMEALESVNPIYFLARSNANVFRLLRKLVKILTVSLMKRAEEIVRTRNEDPIGNGELSEYFGKIRVDAYALGGARASFAARALIRDLYKQAAERKTLGLLFITGDSKVGKTTFTTMMLAGLRKVYSDIEFLSMDEVYAQYSETFDSGDELFDFLLRKAAEGGKRLVITEGVDSHLLLRTQYPHAIIQLRADYGTRLENILREQVDINLLRRIAAPIQGAIEVDLSRPIRLRRKHVKEIFSLSDKQVDIFKDGHKLPAEVVGPTHFFKITVPLPDKNDPKAGWRAYTFIAENSAPEKGKVWTAAGRWVSIDAVEAMSGLDLFPKMSAAQQKIFENQTNTPPDTVKSRSEARVKESGRSAASPATIPGIGAGGESLGWNQVSILKPGSAEVDPRSVNKRVSSRSEVRAEGWKAFVPYGIQENPAWVKDPLYQKFKRPGFGRSGALTANLENFDAGLEHYHLQVKPGGRGLSLGFGDITMELPLLLERYKLGEIHGVEWNAERVQVAAEAFDAEKRDPRKFIIHHLDMNDLKGVPDGSMDLVVGVGITSAGGDEFRPEFAREIVRVLAPGGIAFLNDAIPKGEFSQILSDNGKIYPSGGLLFVKKDVRSEARAMTAAEIGVAHGAAEDVFRIGRLARAELGRVLQSFNPVAYAMSRSDSRTQVEKLLTTPAKLESGREQVSVIFGSIPQAGDPVLQMFVNVMAKSKFLRFQIAVPGAGRAELGAFKEMLVKEVNRARTVKGGVNLDVVSEEASVSRFVGGYPENALVYDMREDREGLAELAGAVSRKGEGKETLFVYNDTALPLSQRSYALLAAINALLEKHIPKEIQAASHVLRDFAENLRIAAESDKAVASAA